MSTALILTTVIGRRFAPDRSSLVVLGEGAVFSPQQHCIPCVVRAMVAPMLESRESPLAPRHVFAWRLLKFLLGALALASFALGIGVLGYHFIARFSWVDSLLNASMILGGMGPMGELQSDEAKIFASAYALFSGLIFITVTGIVLAPVAHRVLHLFHLDDEDNDNPS